MYTPETHQITLFLRIFYPNKGALFYIKTTIFYTKLYKTYTETHEL